MNKYHLSNIHTGDLFKRVDRRTARRLYNNGTPLIIVPCKCFTEMFSFETKENEKDVRTFDNLVNEFEYYNCNYECGYYAAFYVKYSTIYDQVHGGVEND